MKAYHRIFCIAVAMTLLATSCGQDSNKQPPQTKAGKEKVDSSISKAAGYFLYEQFKLFPLQFDTEQVIQGFRDAAGGKEPPMTQKEFAVKIQQIRQESLKAEAQQNLKEAEDFLRKNADESGVISEDEGKLQYVVLEEGIGEEVTESSHPTVHYKGAFIDGTVFDSSIERGEPATFELEHVVPGFRKGIVGMREGGKRRIFIHPELGYGERGPLKPNSLLIFDVELIKANSEE